MCGSGSECEAVSVWPAHNPYISTAIKNEARIRYICLDINSIAKFNRIISKEIVKNYEPTTVNLNAPIACQNAIYTYKRTRGTFMYKRNGFPQLKKKHINGQKDCRLYTIHPFIHTHSPRSHINRAHRTLPYGRPASIALDNHMRLVRQRQLHTSCHSLLDRTTASTRRWSTDCHTIAVGSRHTSPHTSLSLTLMWQAAAAYIRARLCVPAMRLYAFAWTNKMLSIDRAICHETSRISRYGRQAHTNPQTHSSIQPKPLTHK